MRHMRLRLRRSALLILALLVLMFLGTFYSIVWSTSELERQDQAREPFIPPGAIPFWSAINHPNIYDLHATPTTTLFVRTSNVSQRRIAELFELVRNARVDQSQSHSFAVDQSWSFEQLLARQKLATTNDTTKQPPPPPDAHIDTADSAAAKTSTTTTAPSDLTTTTVKPMSESDKLQLRYYIHQVLAKWKKEHQHDKIMTLAELVHDDIEQDEPTRLNTTWYEYMKTVNNLRVYDTHNPIFQRLLKHLQRADIIEASEMSQGTQIKVIFDLPDGIEALFKPYRVPRNYQMLPDHFYFSDIERHHAEIAAFHLDRILGFNRVPPVIGRIVNMTSDIRSKATEELAKTFFTSPSNNTCFRGHCSYYCDTSHAVCGKPGDRLEGSVQVLLPRPPEIEWDKITHPYRRSYSSIRKAKWESNENYCYDRVLTDDEYHNRLLLDMMDLSAFDFLIGNMDRHHMMRIGAFGENTALIHLDNGRSFARYDFDDLSILTPIRQCCFFRYSTFARLYRVYRQGLSTLLSRSLEKTEQLRMILVNEHLLAVDRRLEILFAQLDTCIQAYTVQGVMIDDEID